MKSAIDRITELGDKLGVAIFFGRDYTSYSDPKPKWDVKLEFKGNGIEIKAEGEEEQLWHAIQVAWDKLSHVVENGVHPSALQPAIEHKQAEPEKDEIPF